MRRLSTRSHSGRFLRCWASAAWASGSQAKRWLPRCQSAFSHCARVCSTCRCSVARARSSPWVVRTTTHRCPAGASGTGAQKQRRPPAARRRRRPQRCPGLLRRVRHPTDPADPCRREAGDVLGAVQTTIGDKDRRLPLSVRRPQLVSQRFHGGHQAHFVTGVAIQRLAEQRHIALPGRRQRQHPLLEVRPVIPRIAIRHGNGLRIQIGRIFPVYRKRGRIHMHLTCRDAECWRAWRAIPANSTWDHAIEPIQRAP